MNSETKHNEEQAGKADFRCGFVALIGRPNVGKSTLLNSLIGEKIAAVSPKAQTTRRRFRGIRTDETSQLILVDTPGLHRAPEGKKLNEFCVSEALDSLAGVDVAVYIIDGSRPFQPENPESDEYFLLQSLKEALIRKPRPLFVLLNKMDIWETGKANFGGQAQLTESLKGLNVSGIFPISAKNGDGLEALLTALKEKIPKGPALFPEDEITDQSMRSIVGELIQESIFYLLGEELPYSCAVEIEKYDEPSESRKYPEISASIHVERDSQKPMVIGKGGSKIKEIGQSARGTIEKFLGQKVVLRLFVKVTPKWTKNAAELKRLGYILPERQ